MSSSYPYNNLPECTQALSKTFISGGAMPHNILRLKCNEYKLVY